MLNGAIEIVPRERIMTTFVPNLLLLLLSFTTLILALPLLVEDSVAGERFLSACRAVTARSPAGL